MTGPELLKFVNNELFPHLRALVSTNGDHDQRAIIAQVFRETFTRFRSGYLLRDVVNLVNGINFNSADDIHTMARLYESMLKEMRDAAGNNGEFYTPRPVIRFIVQMIHPELGDTIFDPACGTGGFLVEAYEFLKAHVKTKQDRDKLQYHTLRGVEKKPTPYLLGMMNLLLHEIDRPNLSRSNALIRPLNEIGDKDRVDIIVTNPPFGGEEEKGIQLNFPEATRCSETALLFLQLIMRSLKKDGRCGMVVPNGFLEGYGVCARIKEQLLRDFDLHTIVRLPLGVFAPYTNQETNLLFFDRTGPTKEIWYYEHPLPSHRQALKNPCYTMTEPLVFEEFEPLRKWWKHREANDCAWIVPVSDVEAVNYNLDIRHPKHSGGQTIRTRFEVCRSLEDGLTDLSSSTQKLLAAMKRVEDAVELRPDHTLRTISEIGVAVNPETKNPQKACPTRNFKYADLASVYMNQFENVKVMKGADAPSRARRVMREDDVILATVRPYLCGHAVVPAELDGEICSTGFAVLRCPDDLHPRYLYYMLISPRVISQFTACMRGAHYPALNDDHVQNIVIPYMPYDDQESVVECLDRIHEKLLPLRTSIEAFGQRIFGDLEALFPAILSDVYGEKKPAKKA